MSALIYYFCECPGFRGWVGRLVSLDNNSFTGWWTCTLGSSLFILSGMAFSFSFQRKWSSKIKILHKIQNKNKLLFLTDSHELIHIHVVCLDFISYWFILFINADPKQKWQLFFFTDSQELIHIIHAGFFPISLFHLFIGLVLFGTQE